MVFECLYALYLKILKLRFDKIVIHEKKWGQHAYSKLPCILCTYIRVYMGTYNQVKNSAKHREQKTILLLSGSVFTTLFSVPNHLRKRDTLQHRYTYTVHTRIFLRYLTIIIRYIVIVFFFVCFLIRPTRTRSQLYIIDVPARWRPLCIII